MATQKNNNDTKKAAGYFKEKFTIGLSRVTGDEVTRAIMKTTSHMLKAPNEKHLQRLLSATHGHFSEDARKEGNMCKYIVEELEKRSHTHNWVVVLKTMLTFHAFQIDGSDDVNKVMQRNRNLFCGRSIKDLADSPDGAAQQRFITSYIRYLEERNITQMRIDLEVRIESSEYLSALKMMPMGVLAQALTQLLQQLECIAVIDFREPIVNNFATLEAHTRLVADGAQLYAFISDRIIYAIEHFEELESKAEKETWITVYKRFLTCIHHLKNLFESMRRSKVAWGSIVIPTIKEFPSSLLTKMEESLAGVNTATEDVPVAEDLNSVLQQEAVEQPSQSLPPTTSSRTAHPEASPVTPTATTPAAATPATATVNLFGDDSQFTSATTAPQEPPKPKLQDLDDLFGGATNGNAAQQKSSYLNGDVTKSNPQQAGNFDIFGTQPSQASQPAWGATTQNNQFGYASSSGSAASPFANTTAATNVNNANLFGNPLPSPATQSYTNTGQVPFGNKNNQNSFNNMFGNPNSDFAPIADSSTNRFDPFGAPPRENVFASQPNATASIPTNQQRPKSDMDDLFS